MMLADWIISIFLLPATLVPALGPQRPEGWTGETVLLRKSNTPFYRKVRPDDADPNTPDGTLRGIEHRVVQDLGEKVVLFTMGAEVLVNKEDLVLLTDAVAHFTEEIEREPTDSRAFAFRGWALYRRGKGDDALKDYAEAIRLAPSVSDWHNNRAVIHNSRKEYDQAIADLNAALQLNPNSALAHGNRAVARMGKKEYDKAIADYERSIQLIPNMAGPHNGLAWVLATCPDEKYRDGKRAVEFAKKACELTGWRVGSFLDTLAAAHAEYGDFDEAVKWQVRALDASDIPKAELEPIRKRLQMFKEKKPYRIEEK